MVGSLMGSHFLFSRFCHGYKTKPNSLQFFHRIFLSSMATTRLTGVVSRFSNQKGYGFIKPDNGTEDVFVHQSDGFPLLYEGQKVEFSVKYHAVDVTESPNGESPDGVNGFGASGVIYFRNYYNEFYCVDLEAETSSLSPITSSRGIEDVGGEDVGGWTVIDECIYGIGGMKKTGSCTYAVGDRLRKYNITTNSNWEYISPPRNLPWYQPYAFALDSKIYVVSGCRHGFGSSTASTYDKDTDCLLWGESYDLVTQTWQLLPTTPEIIDIIDIYSWHTSLMDDGKTILIYSFFYGFLMFCDIGLSEYTSKESHPHLSLTESPVPKGLENCPSIDVLESVVTASRAVISGFTLYWFHNDLCLYGYDCTEQRWFQSNSLRGHLSWQLPLDLSCLCDQALLFDLGNGIFLALASIDFKQVGMASFQVLKQKDSLKVSFICYKTFDLATSENNVHAVDGIAMLKKTGSVVGKRKSALED